MSRSTFAKSRKRDSRGRFIECDRRGSTKPFCPTREYAPPIAITPRESGLKGLVLRVFLTFRMLIFGKIPVRLVKCKSPKGDLNMFLCRNRVRETAQHENDEQ